MVHDARDGRTPFERRERHEGSGHVAAQEAPHMVEPQVIRGGQGRNVVVAASGSDPAGGGVLKGALPPTTIRSGERRSAARSSANGLSLRRGLPVP
jgi:hypothetical protein